MKKVIIVCLLAIISVQAEISQLAGDYILVSNKNVYLSDLFPMAENGTAVITKAPTPGNKKVIKSAKLKEIAKQHNLDWSGDDITNITIERRYVPMSETAIAFTLRPEIVKRLGHEDFELQMDLTKHPIKLPAETDIDYILESLQLVSESVFKANLRVIPKGEAPIEAIIGGKIINTAEVPTVNHFIRPGEIIQEVDIIWKEVPANTLSVNSARDKDDLLGKTARYGGIYPGKLVSLNKLTAPKLIKRGSLVTVHYHSPQLSLTVRAVAKGDGKKGQLIQLERRKSKSIIEAYVTGAGRATVQPVVAEY